MAGYVDVGGARLEILEKDYDRALELMREGGYAQYVDMEDEPVMRVGGWTRHIPFLRDLPLERQILYFFIFIAVMLALFVYFGSLLSSN